MKKMKAKEDIAYDQFKEMEKRYHTWMNYYSLFNGALLVAYCTILVSTGQVIEMGGEISTGDGLTGNVRLFQLECTYWNILTLIAFLGCIASYCWYLSAIGHYHWIGRWRDVVMSQENYPKLSFNVNRERAIHYHSTYKITRRFIGAVLLAWTFVCYSSITKDNFQLECCKLFYVFVICCSLFLAELTMHFIVGSDLSIFTKKKDKSIILLEKPSKEIVNKVIDIFGGIILIAILTCSFYFFCNKKESFESNKNKNGKIESLSTSSITNDSILISIKHY